MSKKSFKKVVQYDKIIKDIRFIFIKYDFKKFSKNCQRYFETVTKDYQSLITFSFVSCWLEYVMDKSVVSMRDLFKRLNLQGIDLTRSNFSKASKKRDTKVFQDIIYQLKRQIKKKLKLKPELYFR